MKEADQAVERIEAVLDELTDAGARAQAEELVRVLMELYGAGLRRTLEILREAEFPLERLAEDRLVGSLLLMHDLHPVDAETRIRRALAPVAERVELVGLEEGVARVRITGGGCGAEAVEQVIREAAPEIERVEIASPLVQIT